MQQGQHGSFGGIVEGVGVVGALELVASALPFQIATMPTPSALRRGGRNATFVDSLQM